MAYMKINRPPTSHDLEENNICTDLSYFLSEFNEASINPFIARLSDNKECLHEDLPEGFNLGGLYICKDTAADWFTILDEKVEYFQINRLPTDEDTQKLASIEIHNFMEAFEKKSITPFIAKLSDYEFTTEHIKSDISEGYDLGGYYISKDSKADWFSIIAA